MKCIPAKLAALLLLTCASPVLAQATTHRFAVPPASLDRALSILASQANVDIGGTLPDLGKMKTAGVSGTMSTPAALARLLAGTDYEAVPVGRSAFRIVRRSHPSQLTNSSRRLPMKKSGSAMPATTSQVEASEEILITADKREGSRLRFAGSVARLPGQLGLLGQRNTIEGIGALTSVLPILQSTELGAGRNKIFIRGIADSSFSGPTQDTATTYFGDVPLGYSGPDPNLSLYDVDSVEILEGPQGTLYGAGPIGGVIRLNPNPPDLSRPALRVSAGITATEHGAPGTDAAGVVNLPIVPGRLALRLVGYGAISGGYIKDLRRNLDNINQTRTLGGRADLKAAPASGWSIDGGIIYQTIDAPDSQYAQRSFPGLSRASRLAQLFEDDFLLGHLVTTKQWDSGLRLVWASGLSNHQRNERFDASSPAPSAPTIAYDASNDSRLFSQELRFSRSLPTGENWVLGVSFLVGKDQIHRLIGPPQSLNEIVGVTDRTVDAALFGEGTFVATRTLLVTGGARLTRARTDSSPTIRPRNHDFISGRTNVRLDPSLGLSWLVAPKVALFARYQSGFRTGGLSVAPGIGRVEDFQPDKVGVAEAGIRMERRSTIGVAGSASLSYARWSNIQADLVDRRGLPYTTNIGDGRLIGLEINGDWIPTKNLRLSASAFFNHSRLTPSTILFGPGALPDTPAVSASGGLTYQRHFAGGTIGLDGNIRYVGRSYIGARPFLGIRQGGYVDDAVSLEWHRAHLGLSLSVRNVTDTLGDRFAIGNPFELAARDQYTPLRPRNIRAGVDLGW